MQVPSCCMVLLYYGTGPTMLGLGEMPFTQEIMGSNQCGAGI
jgi:hypothetical protein